MLDSVFYQLAPHLWLIIGAFSLIFPAAFLSLALYGSDLAWVILSYDASRVMDDIDSIKIYYFPRFVKYCVIAKGTTNCEYDDLTLNIFDGIYSDDFDTAGKVTYITMGFGMGLQATCLLASVAIVATQVTVSRRILLTILGILCVTLTLWGAIASWYRYQVLHAPLCDYYVCAQGEGLLQAFSACILQLVPLCFYGYAIKQCKST